MRVAVLVVLAWLGGIVASASAGTVSMVASTQASVTNSCQYGIAPELFWPVVLKAASGSTPCEYRLSFAAVPESRVPDLISAHANAFLSGRSGFEMGVLAADDTVAGAVPVPFLDNQVVSTETTVPLQTAGGFVTLVLRAATGPSEVWVGGASVILVVTDATPPVIDVTASAPPADVLLGTSMRLVVRFADNGPAVGAGTATIAWGDGATSDVATAAPVDPFAPGTQTTAPAFHDYVSAGVRTIAVTLRDDAGNVSNGSLASVRVWAYPANLTLPRVTGKFRRGSTLTCHAGAWSNTGGATPLAYRWKRGARSIAGATRSTYVLASADRDASIGCRVTGSNPAGGATTVASDRHRFWVAPTLRSRPGVRGNARGGSSLTCSTGKWRWTPQTFRYAWIRNGRSTGAHGRRLKLKETDVGKKLACRVTASNPGGRGRATSRAVTIKAKPAGGNCDPSYPGVCIPPPPPDLDCGQISQRNFTVIGSDPHGFDGDNDGIGCET